MGKFTKNNMLWIGLVTLAIGLVLTFVSWTVTFYGGASFLNPYRDLANVGEPQGDWNTIIFIFAPIVLITGAWYTGEQLLKRRRFERLIDTTKKSEFLDRRKQLKEIARILPDAYASRIKEKEEEFRSKRA